MNTRLHRSVPTHVWLWIVGIGLVCLGLGSPISSQAAPVISSTPPTEAVQADEIFSYQMQVSGTELTFGLDEEPAGMTISPMGFISWAPVTTGTYRAIATVRDSSGGFTAQPFQITVTPGALTALTITPNDRPTIVKKDASVTFTAHGVDAEGNTVPLERVGWTATGDVGTISSTGVFTGKKGGIAEITAQLGVARASVGVVVTDVQETPVTPKGAVLGDSTTTASEEAPGDVLAATDTTPQESGSANVQSCNNWPPIVIFGMIVVYPIVLIAYNRYMNKRPNTFWWLFPALLTVIALIIYSKYLCEGTYLWWPWVMLGIGVIITMLMAPRHTPEQN